MSTTFVDNPPSDAASAQRLISARQKSSERGGSDILVIALPA
jgi:hypothetical protein